MRFPDEAHLVPENAACAWRIVSSSAFSSSLMPAISRVIALLA